MPGVTARFRLAIVYDYVCIIVTVCYSIYCILDPIHFRSFPGPLRLPLTWVLDVVADDPPIVGLGGDDDDDDVQQIAAIHSNGFK